jgi:hypothetical protein
MLAMDLYSPAPMAEIMDAVAVTLTLLFLIVSIRHNTTGTSPVRPAIALLNRAWRDGCAGSAGTGRPAVDAA